MKKNILSVMVLGVSLLTSNLAYAENTPVTPYAPGVCTVTSVGFGNGTVIQYTCVGVGDENTDFLNDPLDLFENTPNNPNMTLQEAIDACRAKCEAWYAQNPTNPGQ